jgi:hypothetical protein
MITSLPPSSLWKEWEQLDEVEGLGLRGAGETPPLQSASQSQSQLEAKTCGYEGQWELEREGVQRWFLKY